ncbi:hypothetical protein BMS3Bbin06_00936 [bacterium BMS3Bbin06]|nr:hypothetical protein BMS3Abin08_01535 [bacterium BMS3Abin08]GBE34413.1 hypothetical protein BMS3Bbin06_00936 [bacterium BMS3Bbin06]
MADILILIFIALFWVLLQTVVLPRLGIPT